MRVKPLVLVALLAVLGGVALVQRGKTQDELAPATLAALLEQPLDQPTEQAPLVVAPAWRALLEQLTERTPDGLTLRLGRVLSDPTAARLSAESAGELLALEAEGPAGKLGLPLWRAILAGPALERDPGPALKLYGCRHSARPGDGPALEDSYHARLSLAHALRALATTEPDFEFLTLRGEETPVKGGVNFEVTLLAETQSVVVTFDGHPAESLRTMRHFRPSAPNDARARASFAQALREHAAAAGLGVLTIEDAEPGEGVDVRIEHYGDHLSLVASHGTTRIATHLVLASAREQ